VDRGWGGKSRGEARRGTGEDWISNGVGFSREMESRARQGEIIRPRSNNEEQGNMNGRGGGLREGGAEGDAWGLWRGEAEIHSKDVGFGGSLQGGVRNRAVGSMSGRLCKNRDGEGRGHSNSAATEQAKRGARRAGGGRRRGQKGRCLSETGCGLAGVGCFVEAGSVSPRSRAASCLS
jgi:hypothetical protein